MFSKNAFDLAAGNQIGQLGTSQPNGFRKWGKWYDTYQWEPVHEPEFEPLYFKGGSVKCNVICRMGGGTFGDVYLITNEQKMPFACKLIKSGSNTVQTELEAFRRINREPHPNLLQMVAFEELEDAGEFYDKHVFITRAMGASIAAVMNYAKEEITPDQDPAKPTPKSTFSSMTVLKIGRQIVEAMLHLEKLGIYHLDLKPSNILFVNQFFYFYAINDEFREMRMQNKHIVVADYGCAFFNENEYVPGGRYQTAPYRAPEIFLGIGPSKKTDVWSLGATLSELYIGDYVFGSDGFEDQSLFETMLRETKQTLTVEDCARVRGPIIDYQKILRGEWLVEKHPRRLIKHDNLESTSALFAALNCIFTLDDRVRATFQNLKDRRFFN